MKLPNKYRVFVLVVIGSIVTAVTRAEDPTLPTFHSFAGAFLLGDDHNYYVESELRLPVFRTGPASVYYRHRQSTPFLDIDNGVQAELLYTREEGQVDFKLGSELRLITVAGYHSLHLEDRAGLASAYVLGGGVGSPLRTNGDRYHWFALAGTYINRRDLSSDWWSELYATWRAIDFLTDNYMGSDFRASLQLTGRADSSNEGDRFRALYRVGPEIQFLTANGNRANLHLGWYYNDNNPFYGVRENGLLFGLDIASSHSDEYILHAREKREPGWFPLIWGDYDVGFGGDRRIQRFTMNVEAVDFVLFNRTFTHVISYESRQEHRVGDFDNIIYTVTLGVQSSIGFESALTHGDPLILGIDFFHRSDHALNPDEDLVATVGEPTSFGPMIPNESINILPRLRLQTQGWALPYRDPRMYERKTEWLHSVDWRITAGYTANSSRPRSDFSGQIAVNWDIATVEGYVVYLLGIGSIADESPDWLGELGVRRPSLKVFGRAESYGVDRNIARGDSVVFGIGVNL